MKSTTEGTPSSGEVWTIEKVHQVSKCSEKCSDNQRESKQVHLGGILGVPSSNLNLCLSPEGVCFSSTITVG
jgi:hypothetical protein